MNPLLAAWMVLAVMHAGCLGSAPVTFPDCPNIEVPAQGALVLKVIREEGHFDPSADARFEEWRAWVDDEEKFLESDGCVAFTNIAPGEHKVRVRSWGDDCLWSGGSRMDIPKESMFTEYRPVFVCS